jgi:hypothetical protein
MDTIEIGDWQRNNVRLMRRTPLVLQTAKDGLPAGLA